MGSFSRHLSVPPVSIKVGTPLDEAQRLLILATLKACDGSKPAAAKLLGISVKTIYNKLRTFDERDQVEQPALLDGQEVSGQPLYDREEPSPAADVSAFIHDG